MGTLYDILGQLSVVLLFIALIIGIVKFGVFTKNEKWYIYYIIFIAFIESNSLYFSFLCLGLKAIFSYIQSILQGIFHRHRNIY
jgi:hypothetical protein